MTAAQTINGALRKVPTWPIYVIGAAIPVWLFYQGLTGGLGVDPVKALEHEVGRWGLKFLVAGLAVTPIRRLTNVSLLKFRRSLGLVGFFLIACHLTVWLALDVQILSQVWADILKRPYITVGMAAFVLMIPLAATSWNGAIRRIGPLAWRRLHKLVYAVVLLGGLHFIMLEKTWSVEALTYMAIILTLLALRIPMPRRMRTARA